MIAVEACADDGGDPIGARRDEFAYDAARRFAREAVDDARAHNHGRVELEVEAEDEAGIEGSRRALDCRIDGVYGTGDYPLPDLPRETSRSRATPEKSVQFGPDGTPFS